MDIHVFDVHGQVLQRTIGLDLPELDKIPLAGRPDGPAIDEVAFFHQPVYFLVVNVIALPAQLPGHLQIAITHKLLIQHGSDLVDYRAFSTSSSWPRQVWVLGLMPLGFPDGL